MEEKPSYYAIIPADVRYDEELTSSAKLFYGEITALCQSQGVCWASNEYFSNLYKTNERTVQRWLKELESRGHIAIEYSYKKGTKFVEKRCICIKNSMTKMSLPPDKNVADKHDKNVGENNTRYLNNTRLIKDIVEYLNSKTNKHFESSTKNTVSSINARLAEGRTFDDFKKVIDKKTEQWLNNEKMNKFLRPSTLFSPTNFENYLNEGGDDNGTVKQDYAKQYNIEVL